MLQTVSVEKKHTGQLSDKISICIVNWNTKDYLVSCLQSIQKYKENSNIEIIVVDNASEDGSAQIVRDRFCGVKLISNDKNLGYAHANNQAFLHSVGEYILFLNPDTEVDHNIFPELINKMKSDVKIGALSCQLRNFDGSIQNFCSSFPNVRDEFFLQTGFNTKYPQNHWAGHRTMNSFSHDFECEIEQPPGTFIFTRRDVLAEVGCFDEQFPILYNDVDLCRKIIDAGLKIVFTPSVYIYHHKSVSIKKNMERCLVESFYMRWRYYDKYFSGFSRKLMRFLSPFFANRQEIDQLSNDSNIRGLIIKSTYDAHFKLFLEDIEKNLPDVAFDLITPKIEDLESSDLGSFFHRIYPYVGNGNRIEFFSTDWVLLKKLIRERYDYIIFPHATVDGAGYWNVLYFASFLFPRRVIAYGVNRCWNLFLPIGLKQIRGIFVYVTAYLLLILGECVGNIKKRLMF